MKEKKKSFNIYNKQRRQKKIDTKRLLNSQNKKNKFLVFSIIYQLIASI